MDPSFVTKKMDELEPCDSDTQRNKRSKIIDLTEEPSTEEDSDIEEVVPESDSDDLLKPVEPELQSTFVIKGRPHKSWMYTINNYTESDEKRLQGLDCTFHVYGREVGENGTPHLQGCITFQNSMRFKAASRLLGGHLTVPKVLDHARNYCMKDSDCFLKDNRRQGERTDIAQVSELLLGGASIKEAALKHSAVYVKYPQGFKDIATYAQKQRTAKPFVCWFYGPTGVGKTSSVYAIEEPGSVWPSSGDLTYFNGYDHQKVALFDDFRGGFCKFRFLLRLLDHYPITVNVKHGFRQWNVDRIYITSSKKPSDCYNLPDEDMGQLLRRIEVIASFSTPMDGVAVFQPDGSVRPNFSIEKGLDLLIDSDHFKMLTQ